VHTIYLYRPIKEKVFLHHAVLFSFTNGMNLVTRSIWLILNILFGQNLSYVFFTWIACDLQIPFYIKNFISNYLTIFTHLFQMPYIQISSLSIFGKLAINAFLFAIFGIFHTLLAQEFVQAFFSRYLFPKETLRTAYCISVSITVFLIMGFWQRTQIQLWNLLPSTMDINQQQIILSILFLIVSAPGNFLKVLLIQNNYFQDFMWVLCLIHLNSPVCNNLLVLSVLIHHL
jgi:hypothetical protein